MSDALEHINNSQPKRGVASHAIRRPIGTMAITSVIIVLGFFFLDRLPVDLLPEINYPQIRVTVNYPGTAPEVMEQQVTRVLEQNLAATENLIRITGRVSEGRTNVELYFDYGTDIEVALQNASRNLEFARTRMPPDIEPPRIYKYDPSQDPVYVAGFSSTMRSPIEVRDWMENELSPQLQALNGVGGVQVAGGLIRELQVVLDVDRLHSYGLTMNDVITALEEENRDVAAGQVTSDRFDVMATFAMMGMSNLSLNIMSLGGLALGVGLLLDNAIVMLENIFRHNEDLKKSPEESAHEGAAEVSSAIVASTMTNLAAVLPFLLITGLASMLFGELILTIAFAILASLAAALTLVPMLAALLSKVKYRSGLETSRFNVHSIPACTS